MVGEELINELIRKAVAAAEVRPENERAFLKWRGQDTTVAVVRLPVDKVLLNPRSHRIRAQLESSEHRKLVETQPDSPNAQNAIEGFLRDTDNYRALKQNLRDVGQTEPGLITAQGMLVNANTRCVALREIGEQYIRVGVLPPDATTREVDEIELSLQMRRDFRSEYSFTNELLFIDELLKLHQLSPEDVAIEMRWASPADKRALRAAAGNVVQQQRILVLIREVQQMSGGQLRLIDFDSRRQALSEIDSDTNDLRNSDPEAAAEIREARLSAMLLDVGYRDLRHIGRGFVTDFLVPVMEDQGELKPYIDLLTRPRTDEGLEGIEGLDVLAPLAGVNDAPERTATGILDAVTGSIGRSEVVLFSEDGTEIQLAQPSFLGPMKRAFETATADAELTKEAGDRLNRPVDLVRRAVRLSKQSLEAHADVKDDEGFDRTSMLRFVGELITVAEQLSQATCDQDDA